MTFFNISYDEKYPNSKKKTKKTLKNNHKTANINIL